MDKLPELPYYAVIFTSLKEVDSADYNEMSARMEKLAAARPGYLGIHSARGEDGIGITISYWKDLKDVASWKADMEHREAQAKGKSDWYSGYEVRICKVERQYKFGELTPQKPR